MRNYELNCSIKANLSEEESSALQEKINEVIQKENGLIIGGLKKPMKNLFALDFQMLPENLLNSEKKLKEISQIIRYLILVKHPLRRMKLMRRRTPMLKTTEKIAKTSQPKVEMAEIDKKLEEILGE